MFEENDSYYDNFQEIGTGDEAPTRLKIVPCNFRMFEVMIELIMDDKFIGIKEIRLRKDFRTVDQKLGSSNVIDDEEYYRE